MSNALDLFIMAEANKIVANIIPAVPPTPASPSVTPPDSSYPQTNGHRRRNPKFEKLRTDIKKDPILDKKFKEQFEKAIQKHEEGK